MQLKSTTAGDDILQLKKFLQQQFGLPEKEWQVIKECFAEQLFPKNEYFISNGKVCRKLAFITKGVVRYCMFRDDGTEATCFFMTANDFAGDPESFFAQKPSQMNVQALTECRLVTLSYENMHLLLLKYSRAKEIFASIDHYVMTKMLYQRTFLLNLDAAVRYREFMKEFPHVLQQVPLSYVANFLGIAQQSLSRLRKQAS